VGNPQGGSLKLLATGVAGFIGGYLVEGLLAAGHTVIGLDNYSKYGEVRRSFYKHPQFSFVHGDAKDVGLLKELASECDQIVAMAAMVGGISYFHRFAYDLMAENERLSAAIFDAAIWAHSNRQLKKINIISSSMVFESTNQFPTLEGAELLGPPPRSTYGFQKLATEYFAKGAWEQYGLPYTVIRPFNCVGIGEQRAKAEAAIPSGNITLAMSHVVPDLIQKIAKGQDPLHILGDGNQVRHYTYGGDVARGIRLCIEKKESLNEDFNISTNVSTTVLELAEKIWKRMRKGSPFSVVHDEPFEYDVRVRSPDISKAARLLGFRAETSLDVILDEVIPWVEECVSLGLI
jgi:nucleoside-diphosphate-sugar epimerase